MNSLVKNMNTEQSEAVRTTEGHCLLWLARGQGKHAY